MGKAALHFWEGRDSRGREVRAFAMRVGDYTDTPNAVGFRVKVPTKYGLEPKGGDTRNYEEAWAKERGGKPPAEFVWAPGVLHKIRDVLMAASLPTGLAIGNGPMLNARAVTEIAVAWDGWVHG